MVASSYCSIYFLLIVSKVAYQNQGSYISAVKSTEDIVLDQGV